MTGKPSLNLLQSAFKRKRAHNAAYTKAALARDCGVSSVFMSNIFTGKKLIPAKKFEVFCKALELDNAEKTSLIQSLVLEKNKNKSTFESLELSFKTNSQKGVEGRKNSELSVNLLTHWYYLAVLEGLSTRTGKKSIEQLAAKLKLSDYQLTDALHFLSSHKMIEQRDGKWSKVDSHLYFPVGKSKIAVRKFHQQMIQKALQDLASNTAEQQFSKRMFSGYTFSVDPKKINEVKLKFQQFLSEVTAEAGDGACTEVYQCNVQLFPLMEDV